MFRHLGNKKYGIHRLLTQRRHLIHNMEDLIRWYNLSFAHNTVRNTGTFSHLTIQKFTVITVAVVNASRSFFSQITKHQNGTKSSSYISRLIWYDSSLPVCRLCLIGQFHRLFVRPTICNLCLQRAKEYSSKPPDLPITSLRF